jgi:predicted DNA-binding transcriptional regulator AlpA
MTERLLTAREVGELVGLSTESILRRWRSGEIPGFRLASNVLRFDPGEVEAWLESCRPVASVRSEAHTGGGP